MKLKAIMKINKLFIAGLAALTLTACNDYLEVEPASDSYTLDFVYESEASVSTALNGVYAKLLSDNLYGSRLYNDFQLNSDVDFAANSNEAAAGNKPNRFDTRSDASNVESFWNNLYNAVESANEFIYNLNKSDIYAEGMAETVTTDEEGNIQTTTAPQVTNVTQMMGEAKVMRAMLYSELLWYFGDIPFTLEPTYATNNFVPEVTDRQAVSDALIADLKHAAEYMKSDKALADAPERISQEAAYGVIARLALQAGGYSLNHDANDATGYKMTRPSNYKEYYQIAREYTKKIIDAGGHALNKGYRELFVDECNFITTAGDDPIFEIPFAKASTGSWGYNQGPTSDVDSSNDTDYSNSLWGKTSGGVRTTALYRYSFDEKDLRRDYVCGMWYYSSQGLPTMRFDYSMHNNKWSKLWNTTGLGKATTSSTGINFAYLRYTDVLLMFAEAENELNGGPTPEAKDALSQVRRRAFDPIDQAEKVEIYVEEVSGSKEDFLKAVLNERKWEFAGENLRWKDLVRNNMYSEYVLFTFLAYFSIAENQDGTANYLDFVDEHDGLAKSYADLVPTEVFWTYVKNYNEPNFPNRSLYMPYIVNPYGPGQKPSAKPAKYFEDNGLDYTAVSTHDIVAENTSTSIDWQTATIQWVNDGVIRPQVLYSMYGYVRGSDSGNLLIVDNGVARTLNINTSDMEGTINSLPAVRYILPYPEEAIARSGNVYKNYYGY